MKELEKKNVANAKEILELTEERKLVVSQSQEF